MAASAIVLQDAKRGDFDRVFPLLDSFWRLDTTERAERFRRLFTKYWETEDDCCGFMLLDGESVVGFLGTLCQTRFVRGDPHRFCNLTSWYVQESHRSQSLRLARQTLRPKDVTFTALTATDQAVRIWKHFGFTILESSERIIYPSFWSKRTKPRTNVISKGIQSHLGDQDLQVYLDHQYFPCEHVLIERDGETCYLIARRVLRKPFSFARVYHLSNPEMFRTCLDAIRNQLCRQLKIASFRVEERFLQGKPLPLTRHRKLSQPRLFRSPSLNPTDVDALYSELLVL